MGMGYAGCQVLIIEEDFIKEQCPTEFQEFMDSFEDNSEFESIDDFAMAFENGEIEDDSEQKFVLKYMALYEDFEKKTDLKISLCYHDSENGDRYDDFTGRAWEVDGVFQYTPAGEKYKDKIKKQSYVMFG